MKPLIHTWSLAVEEQFYILFPLLLIVLRRLNRPTFLFVLIVLASCSLSLADWASRIHPTANFYFLPTRAWELSVGAILAIVGRNSSPSPGWIAEMGSGVGLGAILYAVFMFDATVPFPSVWGLVPVLGTALLLIYANPSATIVGRLLSWRPIVGVGLISYSAYLWHQPLFAFAKIRFVAGVSTATYVALCFLALGLAYVSWRFVERPYRKAELIPRRRVFSSASIVAACLIAFGLVGYLTAGFPNRKGNAALAITASDVLALNQGLSPTCEGAFTTSTDCRTNDSPEIMVWGDSFAMHLVDGIIASHPDVSLIQMTKSLCGPFLDITPLTPKYNQVWADGCLAFNRQVRDWLSSNKTVKFAVLSSPFGQYMNDGDAVLYRDRIVRSPAVGFIAQQFESTLDWLIGRGIVPVVFAPPPSDGEDIGRCLIRSNWLGLRGDPCSIPVSQYYVEQAKVIQFLQLVEKKYTVIWPSAFLCDHNFCRSRMGGVFIYRDEGHLSHEGSRYLGEKMNFYGLIKGEHYKPELLSR